MIKARRLSDVDYVAELGARSLFLTVGSALVKAHKGHNEVFCAHVFCMRSEATQPGVTGVVESEP